MERIFLPSDIFETVFFQITASVISGKAECDIHDVV